MRAIKNLIQAVADDFVRVQRDIDFANFDRLSRYAPIWEEVRRLTPELADALIPPTQSLTHANTNISFHITRSATQEFELSILNLGYATKFELTQFAGCSIQIQLNRDNSIPRRPVNG